jgi:hypothetical protein
MAITSGDILRLVANFIQNFNDIKNVYHVLVTGTGFGSDGEVMAAIRDYFDDVYDNIAYAIADNVEFVAIDGYNLTQDEILPGRVFVDNTEGGGSVNPMLPPQCAALVNFHTDTPGSQGRKFLPPMTDNVSDDDGSPTSGILVGMLAYGEDLIDGYDDGTWSITFGNYRPATDTFIPWASAEPRNLFATQRRRYTGSGT